MHLAKVSDRYIMTFNRSTNIHVYSIVEYLKLETLE
jgi:hypothetical protein